MSEPFEPQQALLEVWQQLSQVRTLKFRAVSGLTNSIIEGRGRVAITRTADHTFTQQDFGTWQARPQPEVMSGARSVTFTNAYRWTLDLNQGRILLEHLRHGANQPVSLVSLVPSAKNVFHSSAPHHCGSDFYSASLQATAAQLELQWHITGPGKQDQITNWYYSEDQSD